MRRPSQVYPFVLPVIDPPDTPSYPSSHALQAHLISGLLKKGLAGGATETARALDHIAMRIATNREVAGVHYNMDTLAGEEAANRHRAARDAAPPAASTRSCSAPPTPRA